jgi:hypothetical protein
LHLAARACGQDTSGAAGELVERQVPAGVVLAQTRRGSFAVDVAGESHATLRDGEDEPGDQAPEGHSERRLPGDRNPPDRMTPVSHAQAGCVDV